MDIVDLVYAKGLGNTCGCTVDIVSGLVDTHSHMHVSAHTHTHTHTLNDYYKLTLMCMLQVLTWVYSKKASYPGPLRKGLVCIARTCTDVVSCTSVVTGHEQCMYSSIYERVWFFGVIWRMRMQCQPWPRYKGSLNRKNMYSVHYVDTGTSE